MYIYIYIYIYIYTYIYIYLCIYVYICIDTCIYSTLLILFHFSFDLLAPYLPFWGKQLPQCTCFTGTKVQILTQKLRCNKGC